VLFTFNRLTAESELVVMRSAGLSHLALAKPVLILAGIAFLILMSLSAYFLPAPNRAFKDMQFEIRNRFVSSLIQEGTFTTISDKLTIYIRSRDERGEVVGLLINDNREPHRPVTILAERGLFADTPADLASSWSMAIGSNSIPKPVSSPDLRSLHTRSRQLARCSNSSFSRGSRALPRRIVLPRPTPTGLRLGFTIEAHQRILIPLCFELFCDPTCLPATWRFNCRGQLKRALLAIVLAFLFELLGIGVNDLASRAAAAIPLMYATGLLPFVLGLGLLMRGNIRLGFRRPRMTALHSP
jgi:lipopolysaccharide export system permease protein